MLRKNNIANISVSHIYNPKKKVPYLRSFVSYQKTRKDEEKAIGVRRKPQAQEGVYYINTVDEIT